MRIEAFELEWLDNPQVFSVNRLEALSNHTWQINNRPAVQLLEGPWDLRQPAEIFEEITDGPQPKRGNEKVQGPEQITMNEQLQLAKDRFAGQYVHEFIVDEALDTRHLLLKLRGLSMSYNIWLNGRFVGYSEDSFNPSVFDIDDLIDRQEKNTLVINLFENTTAKQLENRKDTAKLYRPAELLGITDYHIEDIRIIPRLFDQNQNARLVIDMLYMNESPRFKIVLKDDQDRILADFETTESYLALDLNDIRPWSSEDPYLYTLQIDTLDENHQSVETVSLPVGFRQLQSQKPEILLNQMPLRIKGVHWRLPVFFENAAARREIENELIRMKRNHINLLHIEGFPMDDWFYSLCDRLGMYLVIDTGLKIAPEQLFDEENRYEKISKWRYAILDRINSAYQRLKNHPSILFWNLADSAIPEELVMEIVDSFEKSDPERIFLMDPIQYLPQKNQALRFQGVNTLQKAIELLEERPDQPLLIDRFVQSGGNAMGNLKQWALLDQYENFIGATAGTWKIENRDELLYTGPADGLILDDGKPSPQLEALSHFYRDFIVEPDRHGVRITNLSRFTDLEDVQVFYSLYDDGTLIQRGLLDAQGGPLETKKFFIPWLKGNGELLREVSIQSKFEKPWAKDSYELSFGQSVDGNFAHLGASQIPLGIEQIADNIIFSHNGFRAVFNQYGLAWLGYSGKNWLKKPVFPVFSRAFTDQDKKSRYDLDASGWFVASRFRKSLLKKKQLDEKNRYGVLVYQYTFPNLKQVKSLISYTIAAPGVIGVDVDCFIPSDLVAPSKIGVEMVLDEQIRDMVYYGKGPLENYPDRNEQSRISVYSQPVDSNITPYHHPQDNGNRSEIRWMELLNSSGEGLGISTVSKPLNISVSSYSQDLLMNTENHQDLLAENLLYVTICDQMMGVGAEQIKDKSTIEINRLKTGVNYHFSFIISSAPVFSSRL